MSKKELQQLQKVVMYRQQGETKQQIETRFKWPFRSYDRKVSKLAVNYLMEYGL